MEEWKEYCTKCYGEKGNIDIKQYAELKQAFISGYYVLLHNLIFQNTKNEQEDIKKLNFIYQNAKNEMAKLTREAFKPETRDMNEHPCIKKV